MNTESYQIEKLGEFRTRRKFSFFPFIIVNGYESGYAWTGKWFTFVEITEEKVKERYLEFDDGWSYQSYWTGWQEAYKFIKINLDNQK